VIGNNAYQGGYHLNEKPLNDAEDMTALLEQVGFSVSHYADLNKQRLKVAIQRFSKKIKAEDQVLVYYSGHGMQYQQSNYFIPVNSLTDIKEPVHLEFEAVEVDYLLKTIAYYNPAVNILILDACRNHPFKNKGIFKGSSVQDGLIANSAPSGTLVAYATGENKAAFTGEGRNSPYVEALKKELPRAGQSILDMFTNVRNKVSSKTKGEQKPNFISELDGHFCFVSCPEPVKNSTLDVSSNIQSAYVWLNNKKKGYVPQSLQLKAGEYQVKVTRQGYTPFEKWVDVRGDQRLMAELEEQGEVVTPVIPQPIKPIKRALSSSTTEKLIHNRYLTNKNGTAKDTQTGLTWMRCLVGQTWDTKRSRCNGKAETFTGKQAKAILKNFAGYSDWRLPTIKELRSIVYCSNGDTKPSTTANNSGCDTKKYGAYTRPTIVEAVFPDTPKYSIVWSDSYNSYYANKSDLDNAWNVDFNYGNDYEYSRSYSKHVRLVRGGQ